MSPRRWRPSPPLAGHAVRAAALRLGDSLEQANLERRDRGRRHVDPMTPGGARWLLELAHLDARRRELRRRLAATLELCEQFGSVI